jgi:hypothetical protein
MGAAYKSPCRECYPCFAHEVKFPKALEPGNGKKTLFGVNKTGDYFCCAAGFIVAARTIMKMMKHTKRTKKRS